MLRKILVALGIRHLYALMTVTLSAFVLATIAQEFHKGAKARQEELVAGAQSIREPRGGLDVLERTLADAVPDR